MAVWATSAWWWCGTLASLQSVNDVSTGASGTTAVAHKFSNTCPPLAQSHLNFPHGYVPVYVSSLITKSPFHWYMIRVYSTFF